MMSERANLTLISPAIRDAMEQWLSHERALKAAADNTLNAYATDVAGFVAFMGLWPRLPHATCAHGWRMNAAAG